KPSRASVPAEYSMACAICPIFWKPASRKKLGSIKSVLKCRPSGEKVYPARLSAEIIMAQAFSKKGLFVKSSSNSVKRKVPPERKRREHSRINPDQREVCIKPEIRRALIRSNEPSGKSSGWRIFIT